MLEHSLSIDLAAPELAVNSTSRLRQEYLAHQGLFQFQNALVQQYLHVQATLIVEAIDQGSSRLRFNLPDAVVCPPVQEGDMEEETLPPATRQQFVGSRFGTAKPANLVASLCNRLTQLERSVNRAISVSAELLRFAVASHMVHHMLPAGKSVIYAGVEGDDIPNQPATLYGTSDHAIRPGTNHDSRPGQPGDDQEELVTPYVDSARCFFLPQWIAFDNSGNLLLNSVGEAQACLTSMQRYLAILKAALVIAPYMVADEALQQKRYGMLGQLVNQGRAYAQYQLGEIIKTIKQRVTEHRMDRGLRISLPYFDDQKLVVENYDFTVIPVGRVMFIPAFVVLAAREQHSKVATDTRLSYSTRKHLLDELLEFEYAFTR